MRRHLLNIVTGISLLLCPATALLWARSYERGDLWCRGTNERGIEIAIDDGQVRIASVACERRGGMLGLLNTGGRWSHYTSYPRGSIRPPARTIRERLGLGWRGYSPWFAKYRMVAFPLWLACAALGLPPVVWLPRMRRLRRRRQRQRLGLCVACGYDLRGTRERCPECGVVPARAVSV